MSGTRLSIYRRALLVTCAALSVFCAACERATQLSFDGGSTPNFRMEGTGRLGTLRVHGPEKQRGGEGESPHIYWLIQTKSMYDSRLIVDLDTITYGKVPVGYVQVYPEGGGLPPPLNEGIVYDVRLDTYNAPGIGKNFQIRNGKIEEIPNPPRTRN